MQHRPMVVAGVAVLLLCIAVVAGLDASSYLESQVNAPSYHVNDIWLAHKHLSNWEEVKGAAEDTFEYLPKQYDPAYRNPCWKLDGVFKCLPYFQVLGVSKCGTTDLYNRLTYHPDMVDCGWKGPHFWDESSFPVRRQKPGRYDGSFQAYTGIFDKPALKIQKNKDAITGEASSNTYTAVYSHLRGRTLVKKVNATLAQYLYEATPWARYIVLFRDPVKRYHSAFHYYRDRKRGVGSPKEFLEKTKEDLQHWTSCLSTHSKHFCLKDYQPQQLVKGMYAEFLPAWLEVFPRDRLLFMRNEDYQRAPKEHLAAAIKFLGLREPTAAEWDEIVDLKPKNSQASKYGNSTADLEEAYRLLKDFYRPLNKRLSQAFGDDPRWLWGY